MSVEQLSLLSLGHINTTYWRNRLMRWQLNRRHLGWYHEHFHTRQESRHCQCPWEP